MNSLAPMTVSILNRLVVLHNRSLPVYLTDASPWGRPGQDDVRRVLGDIAADHRATVDQIAKEITDANEYVEVGEFPLLFTCYNDLSLDFLLNRAIELQKRDLQVIDECLEGLETAPRAKALVQEIRGAGLGHLDSMIERQRSSANPAAHGTV